MGMRKLAPVVVLAAMALALSVSACASEGSETVDVGELVIEMCGNPPLRPGWAAAFDNGSACLKTATWNELEAWHGEIDAWRDCVTGLDVPQASY